MYIKLTDKHLHYHIYTYDLSNVVCIIPLRHFLYIYTLVMKGKALRCLRVILVENLWSYSLLVTLCTTIALLSFLAYHKLLQPLLRSSSGYRWYLSDRPCTFRSPRVPHYLCLLFIRLQNLKINLSPYLRRWQHELPPWPPPG